ncbi:MAG TPA: thermonuclease family protein [Gemmatimonadales bacterium]|nr:thermonuclease family protein [Gemmatimonadales bacterium]
MFKKILVVLVALWVMASLFGEDDEPGTELIAGVEAAEPTEPEQIEEERSGAPSEPTSSEPRPSAEVDVEPTGTQSTPRSKAKKKTTTYLVTHVVDGDTIDLGNGQTVRLVGIDTPERGDCGYDQATANMERLVLGKRVRLTTSDEDTDRYGRLLRYVNVGGRDAGLRQITRGLAIARYDSRDGYGFHPRENQYIAADQASDDFACPEPKPKPQPLVPQPPAGNCAAGYSPCIPPYPPDLDCGDVDGPIAVTGSDPHGLDADGDGLACES